MIHLSNYVANILYSVETLPTEYTFRLINNQTKNVNDFTLTNYIVNGTQSELTFEGLLNGEYTYQMISNDVIYDFGLGKISPIIQEKITHKTDKKYIVYGK